MNVPNSCCCFVDLWGEFNENGGRPDRYQESINSIWNVHTSRTASISISSILSVSSSILHILCRSLGINSMNVFRPIDIWNRLKATVFKMLIPSELTFQLFPCSVFVGPWEFNENGGRPDRFTATVNDW
jgi:hypothetical protein